MSTNIPDIVGIPLRPFRGVSAVVTGASSGIGRQIAVDFATAGCENMLVHFNRNLTAAQSVASMCRDLGTETYLDRCDFGDEDQIQSFVTRCFETLSRVDIWVHCAGADVLTGEAANWSFDEKLKRLIDVDLLGSIRAGRLVAERLRVQAREAPDRLPPSILFIGWDQASDGMEGDAGQMFAPIKAGVEAFAKSLAQEIAPWVRVNVVAPGWIQTAWGKNASEYWNLRALNQSLMHRWGEPGDVSAAAVFLSTPANRFITGQTLQLNGGWNRRFEPR